MAHRSSIVGAYEAKTHFSELLERVETGEELTITRHGTPIARLVPARRKSTAEQRRAAIDIEVDAESAARAFGHVLPLARAQGLTSYDAAYLDLALRRHLPLASLDDELCAASKRLGIEILGNQ